MLRNMNIHSINNTVFNARLQFVDLSSATNQRQVPSKTNYLIQISRTSVVCFKKMCLLTMFLGPIVSKILKIKNSVKIPS